MLRSPASRGVQPHSDCIVLHDCAMYGPPLSRLAGPSRAQPAPAGAQTISLSMCWAGGGHCRCAGAMLGRAAGGRRPMLCRCWV